MSHKESLDHWADQVMAIKEEWDTVTSVAQALKAPLAIAGAYSATKLAKMLAGIIEPTVLPTLVFAGAVAAHTAASRMRERLAAKVVSQGSVLRQAAKRFNKLLPGLLKTLGDLPPAVTGDSTVKELVVRLEAATEDLEEKLGHLNKLIEDAKRFHGETQVEAQQILSLGQQRRYAIKEAEFRRRMRDAGMLFKHEW